MQLSPYLFFDGTCEAALAFYAEVLGANAPQITRYGDGPAGTDLPADQRHRVMHATLEAPGVSLMASDSAEAAGEMQRVSLALASADSTEGERVFLALAAGGTITTPYTKQFWGASFGTLVDRFGVHWMVNAG